MTVISPRRILGHRLRRGPATVWPGAGMTASGMTTEFGPWPLQPRVAVLVPCHNEQESIADVVSAFRRQLPDAVVYVYDNNSTDETAERARQAGAVVRREHLQGKGHVVRRMFADVDADAYILVDGDGTYDSAAAPTMLRLLIGRQLDMVSAARLDTEQQAYRFGHRFGNVVLSGIVAWVFGQGVSDLLSGYRVFSRRFVKSFPALSSGFEIETEFTVHALALRMPMQEVLAPYCGRQPGSRSKLNTISDGMRILRAILGLIQHERPLPLFSVAGLALLLLGIGLGMPVVTEFLRTGLVPRLPTALLATALVLLAFLSATCGLILDAVAHARKEYKRIAYLRIPPLEMPE
jgi:hypothetical protein